MRVRACVILVSCFAAVAAAAEQRGVAFAEDFKRLPYFKRGIQSSQFSSTDPRENNSDGTGGYLGHDTNGYLRADITGPGCIYRIWGTSVHDGTHFKVFLDGATSPGINSTYQAFFNNPPLRQSPDVGLWTGASTPDLRNARWSYMPIPFRKSCRIYTDLASQYYQISYHTYTDGSGVKSWTPAQSTKSMEKLWNNPTDDPKPTAGNKVVSKTCCFAAGETKTVFTDTAAGYIAQIRVNGYPPDAGFRIRMTWDQETTPSVDVPVKWFFGSVDTGTGDVRALGVGTVATNGYCYFPMPYWKSAHIEIINGTSGTVNNVNVTVAYNHKAYPQDSCCYFRAQAHSTTAAAGEHYTCLKTMGKGHVVGMAKSMAARHKWACEGNEVFYIDESRYPDIYGTGEEDYNNNAYWRNIYNSYPTHGCVNNDCYYRIHFPDVIAYEQSLDMAFETSSGNWNVHGGFITSLVWYYESSTPALVESDFIDIGNAASEQEHDYAVTGQMWSGSKTGGYPGKNICVATVTDDGRAFTGTSTFTVRINTPNDGVRMRVRTENKNFQKARVFVDNEEVNERQWSTIKQKFDVLWSDCNFEIPARYTRGKTSLKIRIQYVSAESNAWYEYRYWFFTRAATLQE